MAATRIRMTADELLRLPDTGIRRELIAGELHEMPPAGRDHGVEPVLPGFACRLGDLF